MSYEREERLEERRALIGAILTLVSIFLCWVIETQLVGIFHLTITTMPAHTELVGAIWIALFFASLVIYLLRAIVRYKPKPRLVMY